MSKKVQMKVKSVSNGVKAKKEEDVPVLGFSMSGNGWRLAWKGEENETPFEVNKEDIGNEVLVEITFKGQKQLDEFAEESK